MTQSSLRPLGPESRRGPERAEAEGKGTALRDDKPIAGTEPNPGVGGAAIGDLTVKSGNTTKPQKTPPPVRPGLTRTALTEENINKLDRSQAQDTTLRVPPALRVEDSVSSSLAVGESEAS